MRSRLALWRRLTTLPQRRLLEKLTLEEVAPVRLQMFEHLLKIGDVPRLQKLQCVDSFEENLLCMWRERWNVRSRRVSREGKNLIVTLVSKEIDEHRVPPAARKTILQKSTSSLDGAFRSDQ
jgi:hypothetical protein